MDNNQQNYPEEKNKQSFFQTPRFKQGFFYFAVFASVLTFGIIVYKIDIIYNALIKLLGYITPIFYGIVMAYLINPIVMFFQKLLTPFFKKRCKTEKKAKNTARFIAIAIAMLLTITSIVILLIMIIPGVLRSIINLAEILPKEIKTFVSDTQYIINTNTEWGETIKSIISSISKYIEDWVTNGLAPMAESALSAISSGIIDIVNFMFNLLVGIVVAVYVLKDKDKFRAQMKKIIYTFVPPKSANSLLRTARHSHEIFGSYMTGKIIDCIAVGIINAVFMLIVGMDYVALISVVIGVTNIIPFFGPFIGGLPSTLLLLMINPTHGLIFLIFTIVLQQIEGNILAPRILGSATGLSEFWVTFALLFFGGVFGFFGMIVGVPLFAIIYYIIRVAVNKKLVDKNYPVVTEEYRDVEYFDIDESRFIVTSHEKNGAEARQKQKKISLFAKIFKNKK